MRKDYLKELEFYKTQNWYSSFKKNVRNCRMIHRTLFNTYKEAKGRNATILQCSFSWSSSIEGDVYWSRINREIAPILGRRIY